MDSKRKLRPKDFDRYRTVEPELLRQVAAIVCKLGILPEKELHECWQMADIVHRNFPSATRVVDLAAGHGLLSWLLVLLAKDDVRSTWRTAVAVDITRPKSAEILFDAFKHRWPELSDRVYYVESSLDRVSASRGHETLFVAVHACGNLSDRVLISAMQSRSSVAVMPCCHSLRKQKSTLATLSRLSQWAKELVDPQPEAIDQYRIDVLRAAGYSVSRDLISEDITPFNRVILGRNSSSIRLSPIPKIPLTLKARGELQAFESISEFDVSDWDIVRSLSLRPSKEWRRFFDLSFWIDCDEQEATLLEFMEGQAENCPFDTRVTIQDRFIHPTQQKASITLRFEMTSSRRPISKVDAAKQRLLLCDAISERFRLRF